MHAGGSFKQYQQGASKSSSLYPPKVPVPVPSSKALSDPVSRFAPSFKTPTSQPHYVPPPTPPLPSKQAKPTVQVPLSISQTCSPIPSTNKPPPPPPKIWRKYAGNDYITRNESIVSGDHSSTGTSVGSTSDIYDEVHNIIMNWCCYTQLIVSLASDYAVQWESVPST